MMQEKDQSQNFSSIPIIILQLHNNAFLVKNKYFYDFFFQTVKITQTKITKIDDE